MGKATALMHSATGSSGPASPVATITAVDNPAARTIDLYTRQQSTEIDTSVTTVGAVYPENVTFWKSTDNGVTFVGIGWMLIASSSTVFKCTGIVPELPQNWKMAACAGAIPTQPVAIHAASLPAHTIISASIAVTGVSLPSAASIPTLTVSAGAGGSFPYNQVRPDGSQYWSIAEISYNDTVAVADQASFFIRITGQDLDSAHASIGPEQPFAGTYPSTTGATQTFGPLMGDYLTNGFSYVRTGNIAYVRLRVYSCNRIDGTANSFANPSAATLQTGIGGGLGYLDVLVAAGGGQPKGKIGVDRLDPGSFPVPVTSITVVGTIDPISEIITITVVAPQPTNVTGSHLYIEVPDRSNAAAMTLNSSTLGSDAVTGDWNPIDLGVQPYSAAQPWTVTVASPAGVDPTANTPSRLYVASVSPAIDNPLVQAGQTGATPSQAFLLTSASQASIWPVAGTSVTETSGPISVQVLPPDNSTGTLLWPIVATVSSIPNNPGWSAQLVVTWQGADPTDPANQSVVTGIFTLAGKVLGSPDSISTPHSFTLTSNKIQAVTVWVQSGLMDANGNYQWNPIVPGITPSTYATIGAVNGRTIDGTAITEDSIAIDHFAAGVRPVAIFTTNPSLPNSDYPPGCFGYNISTPQFLRVDPSGATWIAAVNGGADIVAGSVTTTQLNVANISAAFASISYLTTNYLTATQIVATYASFTYLSANYITATTLAATYASFTYLTANYATVGALAAKTISANNITTGTCSVTVAFTALTASLTANGITTAINNAASAGGNGYGLSITDGSDRTSYLTQNSLELHSNGGGGAFSAVLSATTSNPILVLTSGTSSGSHTMTLIVDTLPRIRMNGTQVLREQQAGPGNTSDSTDVAVRFNSLLTALRNHGMIT